MQCVAIIQSTVVATGVMSRVKLKINLGGSVHAVCVRVRIRLAVDRCYHPMDIRFGACVCVESRAFHVERQLWWTCIKTNNNRTGPNESNVCKSVKLDEKDAKIVTQTRPANVLSYVMKWTTIIVVVLYGRTL